jgi:hypothetical protein
MMIVTVGTDVATLTMLDEFRSNLLRFAEVAEKPVYLVQLFDSFRNGRLARNLESLTTGDALNRWIVFKPSNSLFRLMSAMRAWNRDHDFIG